MNRNKLLIPAAAALLSINGCAQENPFGSEGKIVAGVETTVLSHTSSSEEALKAGPTGFHLYLLTEDCQFGKRFTPGQASTMGCRVVDHLVDPKTYLEYSNGEAIKWSNQSGESDSEVVDHKYSEESFMTTVYHLGLRVRQCRQRASQEQCTTDKVSIDPAGWQNVHDGQSIIFTGAANKSISTELATFTH